jgi:hypothetical protein
MSEYFLQSYAVGKFKYIYIRLFFRTVGFTKHDFHFPLTRTAEHQHCSAFASLMTLGVANFCAVAGKQLSADKALHRTLTETAL